MKQSHEIVKSKDVVGVNVSNTTDENLGKVEEIILDKLTGQVRYVVLSFGGFLGLGDKYFAVPWKALSYNTDKNAFVFNVKKEKLENAPGFDKNNWPDFADQNWGQSIHKFYETTPYWEVL